MGEVTEHKARSERAFTLSVRPMGCQLSQRESQVAIYTIKKTACRDSGRQK